MMTNSKANPLDKTIQRAVKRHHLGTVEQALLRNATPKEVPMLHKAEDLINGQRQQDYGDKLQNFAQIAMLWQGVLATKLKVTSAITPEDVALCMMQVKIARLAKSPDHADSVLDIAGYAGCYDKLQQERKAGVLLEGAVRDSRNPD